MSKKTVTVVNTETKRKPPHRFKKGESGNPSKIFKKGNKAAVGHGRPPKLPNLDETIAKILSTEGKKGITVLERIIARLKSSALVGNTKATALLLDRGYGRVAQKIEVESIERKQSEDLFPRKNAKK